MALNNIVQQLNIIENAVIIFSQITTGISRAQTYTCSMEITTIFNFYCIDLHNLLIDRNSDNYVITFKRMQLNLVEMKLITCELKSNETGSFLNNNHNTYLPINKSLQSLNLNQFKNQPNKMCIFT